MSCCRCSRARSTMIRDFRLWAPLRHSNTRRKCLLVGADRKRRVGAPIDANDKPKFRAEGDNNRDIRRRRERGSCFPSGLQPHPFGIGPACSARRVSPRCRGRLNRKTAPRGSFAEAHSCPSCASMIERQIESPIPMPLDLVVKNELKRCSRLAGSSPGPESRTATSTPPGSACR